MSCKYGCGCDDDKPKGPGLFAYVKKAARIALHFAEGAAGILVTPCNSDPLNLSENLFDIGQKHKDKLPEIETLILH